MAGTDINKTTSVDNRNYIQYLPIEAAFQAVFLILIMLVAIAANTMNIIVVYRNSNMQTPRYMFIMNLAVGDLGVTLLSMLFSLTYIALFVNAGWQMGSQRLMWTCLYNYNILRFKIQIKLVNK